MTLPSFTKEKNVEPMLEWNNKDFRHEKLSPKYAAFIRQHLKVFEWLKDKPKNSMELGCAALIGLCKFSSLTPEQFLELDKKAARDKAWQYLSSFKMQHPAKAMIYRSWIQSFYYFHVEEKLPFILGKHDIVYEPMKIKYRMDKATCWKIIHKAKNLRDETILLFDFESGLRRNAIAHLNFGHYKNFFWFKKTEDGKVIECKERQGNIAIFKIMATKRKQFTHDNKLRRKKIYGYYGCLHKEATAILKEYIAQYHRDSEDNTPLWYPLKPLNKNKRLGAAAIYMMFKDCVERAGLPIDEIDFHAYRRGFRGVVRNTRGIIDSEFKEAIMGHKLKGSQENYFDKDPLEFAENYAYCDFSEPQIEKDRALAERENEIERLRKEEQRWKEEKQNFLDAIEKAKAKTKIEIEPIPPLEPPHDMTPETKESLHIHPASPELNAAFNEFNDVLEQREQYEKDMKPRLPQTKANRPPLAISKPSIVTKQLDQNDWVVCPDPDKDGWVRQSVECEKCKTETPKKHEQCYRDRVKTPFSPLFKCSKPKPNL